MTVPAGQARANDSPVLQSAIELRGKVREAGDEAERIRHLPPLVVQAMKDAGVFGMALPQSWGAPELDPLTQIRVIEALAIADGSAGWCAMIGCDSGYITAFLGGLEHRVASGQVRSQRLLTHDVLAGPQRLDRVGNVQAMGKKDGH